MRLRRLERVYKNCPIYYLTLVAHERRPLFANEVVHAAFVNFGVKGLDYGVTVGRYVLMPDHIHLFAAFSPESISLSNWVKSLKNSLSKCLRSNRVPAPHWQKGFFDHILRSDESYQEKWEYVRRNPVRAGLVQRPDDWQFAGEIYPLESSEED
jgi:putative transposase